MCFWYFKLVHLLWDEFVTQRVGQVDPCECGKSISYEVTSSN